MIDISIDAPKERFNEHLALKDNNRILFSGKFGTGKSYFLKKYFDIEVERYNVFNLSPVNYVVGANQDIFEWIKVDIATHYLTFHHIPNKNTFDEKESRLLKVSTYIHNNYSTVFKRLVESIIAKTISDNTSLDIKEEIAAYKRWDKEIEDKTEGIDKLYSILSNEKDKIGSIYEEDINTLVLRRAIKSLKDDSPNKESVLIIDDLDRLDPEHIFRILNVLSVHNYGSGENKFGFDKVIVVCDLDNIKHIYGHKYGNETDFNGYIEKFFCYEPFSFDLDDLINFKLSWISSLNCNYTSVFELFKFLIKNNVLSIRNLKKQIDTETLKTNNYSLDYDVKSQAENLKRTIRPFPTDMIEYFNKAISRSNYGIINIKYTDFKGYNIVKLISIICGESSFLKSKLEKLKHSSENIEPEVFRNLFNYFYLPVYVKENIHATNLIGTVNSSKNEYYYPKVSLKFKDDGKQDFQVYFIDLYGGINYSYEIINRSDLESYSFFNTWGNIINIMIQLIDNYKIELSK